MTGPLIPPRFTPRVAQPLENIVDNAKDVIAGLFEKPDPKDMPPAARAQQEQRQRVYAFAARLFDNPDGRELLEVLCDATVRRPVMVVAPNMSADMAMLYAAKREGQNDTIYMLLNMVAEGRGEQQSQREGS